MGRGQQLLNLVKSIKQEKELQTVQEEIKEVIKPENLKAGITAFGVEGNKNVVDTTDANMDYYGAKMLSGYNAYAQGRKVSGTMKSTKKEDLSYFAGTTKIIDPEYPDFILTKQYPSGTIKGAIKKISASAIDPTWIEDKNICIRANYNPSLTYWPKDWRVEIAVCDKDHYFYFKNSSSEQPIYCCNASWTGQPYTLYNAFVDDLKDLTVDLWTKTEVAVSSYMNSNLGKIGTLYAYSRNKSLSTSGLTGSTGVPESKNKFYIQKEVGANTEAAYVSSDYNSAYLDQLDESIIANAINLKPEHILKGEKYLGVEGTLEIPTGTNIEILTSKDELGFFLAGEGDYAMVVPTGSEQATGLYQHNGTEWITVFEQLDTSDATVTPEYLLKNITAYANGGKVTGILESKGAGASVYYDIDPTSFELYPESKTVGMRTNAFTAPVAMMERSHVKIGTDYATIANAFGITSDQVAEGSTVIGVEGTYKGLDTSSATATSEDIITGKTAYVNGKKVTGTLGRSYGSMAMMFAEDIEVPDGLTLRFTKTFDEACAFPKGSYLMLQADIDSLLNAIGLTADKIKKGETILGITGTYEGEDTGGVSHSGGTN